MVVPLAYTPSSRAYAVADNVIAQIDLGKAFGTRSDWRFVATQEPAPTDPMLEPDFSVATVHLCLRNTRTGACSNQLRPTPLGSDWGAQYLDVAKVVYPHGRSGQPLFLLTTASNGIFDQAIYTQLFAYRRSSDSFEQIYGRVVGRNNNEEVRYVSSGPLAGGVVTAEPTEHRPYVYWIAVSQLTRGYRYKQTLRYHSATGYADGNGLAVIDSEMPSILMRLGLWRPSAPLPLPTYKCSNPKLLHMELWCS